MFPESRFCRYNVSKQQSNPPERLERSWIWNSNLLDDSVLPSPGDIVSTSTVILLARVDPTVVRQWERDRLWDSSATALRPLSYQICELP